LQAQINALSALLEKERRREAELELELARLRHANMLDEMLELQVTGYELLSLLFKEKWTDEFHVFSVHQHICIAIARYMLSFVRLSVTRVDQSKTVKLGLHNDRLASNKTVQVFYAYGFGSIARTTVNN